MIYIDNGNQADAPQQNPGKVVVRPQRLDVSILDKVKKGTLPNDTREINIFGSLTDYKSYTINNPATADLRELSETDWCELQHQGQKSILNGSTAVAEFNDQVSNLMAFDDHVMHVGQILHQQQLAHPRHDVYKPDLWTKEQYLHQARKDWNVYGYKQLKLNAQLVQELKSKKEKAKRDNNQAEVAALVNEVHGLESQVLYYWYGKMEEKARKILEPRIWEQINDIEDSYELFQALKIEEEKYTLLELIDTLDTSKTELEANIEDTLAILDANLNHIEGLFVLGHHQAKEAFTRMNRLCATDVKWKGEEIWRKVMLERFMDDKGASYFEACKDLGDVKKDLEMARVIFGEKIERGFEELEVWRGECLDVWRDAERVWLRGVAGMEEET